MKGACWVLIIIIMFLVLDLSTLVLTLADEFSEVLVSTDKDVYTIGETVEITVSMDPCIRCLCFEHEWEVRVERIENNGVVEKWCWKWKARANESGFRGKTIYWTPSEVGRYKVIARLVTHNASASKVIEVIAGREGYKELYENLLRRYDVLREKYDALEDENRALKSKISILEGIVSQLRGEVSSLKNQVASLQQSLSHAEEALNEAKSKLTVTENELAWWRMFTLIVGIVAFVVGLITMHLIIKTRSAMPTARLPPSAQ